MLDDTILKLGDLYAKDVVYTARPSYISNPWLEPNEHQSNFLTGRELLIADMPVIVHEASVTEKLRTLFSHVNQTLPENIYTFKDKASYEALLQTLTQQDQKRIYTQYVHGEDLIAPEHYAMNKQVFIDLNTKSRIPEWTNGKYLPKREVVKIEDFHEALKHWDLPLVIKPGDELPTAGGYGVMICYNQSDLEQAIARIENAKAATQTLIIEQCIETVDNYCVQYALHPKKGIIYLGAAKQLTDDYGFYNGNVNAIDVPESVIQAGYEIMKIGVDKGFIGVAGFDLLVDAQQNIYAIDLNFRHNGSTSLLVLDPVLTGKYHKFYSYISGEDQEAFFQTIEKYIKKGVLYPLSFYDGEYFQQPLPSRFAGIWHADHPEEIERLEEAFKKEANLSS
ncbi:L-aspartate--L-methionine ligase LdmS [Staphylococcus chromogenes]|uniref:L-aspartate--L-methionine ligase LdmS n=1 Tax=Staphylococcus chromogenes TaxID=46126 RepID=UPI000E67F0F7|nr:ATP-grasp domain-containing protein [Staphylococcus chromogenes]RIM07083.1 ATP-grasp domain-containing protein [Staphylococcus chromogenes]